MATRLDPKPIVAVPDEELVQRRTQNRCCQYSTARSAELQSRRLEGPRLGYAELPALGAVHLLPRGPAALGDSGAAFAEGAQALPRRVEPGDLPGRKQVGAGGCLARLS